MSSHEHFFTELTPEVAAIICGGVSTQPNTSKSEQSPIKSRIGRGRARIRYDLPGKLPEQNIKTEDGECRPYYDKSTGQFSFSCVLRGSGIFGDELFLDL